MTKNLFRHNYSRSFVDELPCLCQHYFRYTISRYIVQYFSVEPLPCQTQNEAWMKSENIEVAETELPAEHGEEISYKCSRKFVKIGGDVKLICLDGDLSFNERSPECTKLGTYLSFFLSVCQVWCLNSCFMAHLTERECLKLKNDSYLACWD